MPSYFFLWRDWYFLAFLILDTSLTNCSCSFCFMTWIKKSLLMCLRNLQILELSNQIENNERTFKSLQDLDSVLKRYFLSRIFGISTSSVLWTPWYKFYYSFRYEAVEKIEDALTGLKVIEFGGNNIRLSLRTYVPNLESLLSQHKIEDIFDPLEQTHELVLELADGTMELKNAEVWFKILHSIDHMTCLLCASWF